MRGLALILGKKTEINKIRFAPRGDDNSVREGDEYELKYLSMDGWVSWEDKLREHIF